MTITTNAHTLSHMFIVQDPVTGTCPFIGYNGTNIVPIIRQIFLVDLYDYHHQYSHIVNNVQDPVTGSAHTVLAPYWGRELEKNQLLARQVSSILRFFCKSHFFLGWILFVIHPQPPFDNSCFPSQNQELFLKT